MKQTAVEWLWENLDVDIRLFTHCKDTFDQAKEMEKQQIIDAYENGYSDSDNTFELNKEYYTEILKKNKI